MSEPNKIGLGIDPEPAKIELTEAKVSEVVKEELVAGDVESPVVLLPDGAVLEVVLLVDGKEVRRNKYTGTSQKAVEEEGVMQSFCAGAQVSVRVFDNCDPGALG